MLELCSEIRGGVSLRFKVGLIKRNHWGVSLQQGTGLRIREAFFVG